MATMERVVRVSSTVGKGVSLSLLGITFCWRPCVCMAQFAATVHEHSRPVKHRMSRR